MILRRIYIILAKQLDKPVIRTGMTRWPCSLCLTLKRAHAGFSHGFAISHMSTG